MLCMSRRGGCYLMDSWCDLHEEKQKMKESYEANWLSLVMETRSQYKLTLSETDSMRKQSYEQQQVFHFLTERDVGQTLKLSNCRGAMTEQQHLSRKSHQYTSFFRCSLGQDSVKLNENHGEHAGQQEVTTVTKGLPQQHVQPNGVKFRASSFMSSPSSTSHRVQRRV
ncbi:uncharacterized protein LOC143000777 [Genypterus blacodes]|uniref:uncharacterized protein LOC143000777 n=1 Tax=Genypterus blacodes TaxID=154954 RepID=UPI003F7658A0